VKGVLRPSNANRLYTDEKSTEIGEIKEQKNRKVKRKKRLCCYFVWPLSFNLSGLGGPTRSKKNSSQHSFLGLWGTQSPSPRKGAGVI